jgi:hypothetical protein
LKNSLITASGIVRHQNSRHFAAKSWSKLGIKTEIGGVKTASPLFSTVAHGPADHDRGMKMAAPA